MIQNSASLLRPGEPDAFERLENGARSAVFITCDHASRRIPQALGTLGLPQHERERHIAWDIGARELALGVGASLGATVILQNYSRLVIDCNRPLTSPESIVTASDKTPISGNVGLTQEEIRVRQRTIFEPYHGAISSELDRRRAIQQPTLLVAMHSFTPRMAEQQRPWHIGTLYHEDRRVAGPLLEILRREAGLTVGDNEPYAVGVDTDYTLPVHGEARGLLHVGLEVRQDLIAGSAGQDEWSERLRRAFVELCQMLQL